MKTLLCLCLFTIFLISCKKDKNNMVPDGCDMQKVYAQNSQKLTIHNGVWGTVSLAEGDCMPSVPSAPCKIRHCPIKRTVKIYEYTITANTIPNNPYGPFFDSLNTRLVTQVDTDENGFFQTDIPAGHYSIFIVENGKLYADNNMRDSQGGLCPFSITNGTMNVNLVLNYVTH